MVNKVIDQSYYDELLFESCFKSLKKDKLVILFGASEFGRIVYKYLERMNVSVDYFCDNDNKKVSKNFEGKPVISAEQLGLMDKESNIIITSAHKEEITLQLKKMGFSNIYYRKYEAFYCVNNLSKCNEAIEILNDSKSVKVFHNVLKYKVTNDLKYIKEIYDENQYFDKEIIHLDENEIFVDGGAFTGDTIEQFIKNADNKYSKIIAFEPSHENFMQMKEQYSDNPKIQLENKGLYKENGTISFLDKSDANSYISEEGKNLIKVVKLDNLINEKVTFIKMDIEGSELAALNGGKNLIQKYHPKLAICVYHLLGDLWSLPLYIHEMFPDYKIYLRHYSSAIDWETVCYAVI